MPLTSEQAAKQVEDRLREINTLVHEINEKRMAVRIISHKSFQTLIFHVNFSFI